MASLAALANVVDLHLARPVVNPLSDLVTNSCDFGGMPNNLAKKKSTNDLTKSGQQKVAYMGLSAQYAQPAPSCASQPILNAQLGACANRTDAVKIERDPRLKAKVNAKQLEAVRNTLGLCAEHVTPWVDPAATPLRATHFGPGNVLLNPTEELMLSIEPSNTIRVCRSSRHPAGRHALSGLCFLH